jgi:hypothetical protein
MAELCDSQTLFQLKWDYGQRCSEADPMGSVIRGAWQRGGGMPEMWHFASYATQVVEEVLELTLFRRRLGTWFPSVLTFPPKPDSFKLQAGRFVGLD